MLLNMDCFGLRHASDQEQRAKQQYLTADVNRSLQIHQTSLNLSNNSHLTGGSEGKLMAVAEGRGSTATASRAATLAIDQVGRSMIFDQSLTHTDGYADGGHINHQLAGAIQSCQQAMNREAQAIEAYRDMSANIGIGYVLWPNLHFIHSGPVHCLMLRNGWLTECSNVGGGLTPESEGGIVKRIPLRLGDRIMICTAALKNTLEEFDFKHAMTSRETSSEICESIISRAHENQSGDCSLIVACFDEGAAVDEELQHDIFPAPATAARQNRGDTGKNVRVRGAAEDIADRSARRPAERHA